MSAQSEEAVAKARARSRAWREANQEAAAAYRRRYREANQAEISARNRKWREANRDRLARERKAKRDADPEGAREHDRVVRQRQRTRELQRLKHNARSRAWREQNVDAARERGARFRQEHPEKVREYQSRYRERHPERAREQATRASQRYRDAHAQEIRERQRTAAEERRRANPREYAGWYERNLEAQRARGREASRLRSRLKKAGLPPKQVAHVYALDRRANDAAADEYFGRQRSVEERALIATEVVDGYALQLPPRVKSGRRELLAGKLPAEEYVRRATERGIAGERFDQVKAERRDRTIKRLRDRELAEARNAHERKLAATNALLPQIYEHHRARRGARLREEIRMDSIARSARGRAPYDMEDELRIRLDAEIAPIINEKRALVRERTLRRVDRILDRYGGTPDPAAPHIGSASTARAATDIT